MNLTVKCIVILAGLSGFCVSEPTHIVPVDSQPPGGLLPHQVPQLIHITIDDAVNARVFDDVQTVSSHQNPDGHPVGFTFFVSLDYSDYWLIHRLHARGHEIAVHTVTHTTGTTTNHITWIREIEGCREALHRYAGIPRGDIRGFRAPYLAYNPDMFRALTNLGFAYDASISEGVPGIHSAGPASMIWPYTLHDGLQQVPDTGIKPDEPFPSLLVVPMWKLFHNEHQILMDPWMNEGRSQAEIVQLLKDNFTVRYEGNRIPLGIWLHPAWLQASENVGALNEFLAWALEHEDVWAVPVAKLAEWMYNPVPADQVLANGMFTPSLYEAVPESETYYNAFSKGHFRTVGRPAHAYPHPDTLYRTETVTKPFTVISGWEVGEPDLEGVYLVDLILQTDEPKSIELWTATVSLGNNVQQWGWSNNGIQASPPQSGQIELRSQGAWNPLLTEEPKTVYTFAFKGDPSTLGVGQATFTSYQPKAPRLDLALGPDRTPRFQWENAAPFFQLEGREHLDQGTWEVIQTLYGITETTLPHDTPYRFFRLIAYP